MQARMQSSNELLKELIFQKRLNSLDDVEPQPKRPKASQPASEKPIISDSAVFSKNQIIFKNKAGRCR